MHINGTKIISENGTQGLAQTSDIAAHQIPFTSSPLTYSLYHTCHYWRFHCRRLSALSFLYRSHLATLYRGRDREISPGEFRKTPLTTSCFAQSPVVLPGASYNSHICCCMPLFPIFFVCFHRVSEAKWERERTRAVDSTTFSRIVSMVGYFKSHVLCYLC